MPLIQSSKMSGEPLTNGEVKVEVEPKEGRDHVVAVSTWVITFHQSPVAKRGLSKLGIQTRYGTETKTQDCFHEGPHETYHCKVRIIKQSKDLHN